MFLIQPSRGCGTYLGQIWLIPKNAESYVGHCLNLKNKHNGILGNSINNLWATNLYLWNFFISKEGLCSSECTFLLNRVDGNSRNNKNNIILSVKDSITWTMTYKLSTA